MYILKILQSCFAPRGPAKQKMLVREEQRPDSSFLMVWVPIMCILKVQPHSAPIWGLYETYYHYNKYSIWISGTWSQGPDQLWCIMRLWTSFLKRKWHPLWNTISSYVFQTVPSIVGEERFQQQYSIFIIQSFKMIVATGMEFRKHWLGTYCF